MFLKLVKCFPCFLVEGVMGKTQNTFATYLPAAMNSMELDNEILLIRSPFPKIADPVVIQKLQEL